MTSTPPIRDQNTRGQYRMRNVPLASASAWSGQDHRLAPRWRAMRAHRSSTLAPVARSSMVEVTVNRWSNCSAV
jgi:hypothetical protein